MAVTNDAQASEMKIAPSTSARRCQPAIIVLTPTVAIRAAPRTATIVRTRRGATRTEARASDDTIATCPLGKLFPVAYAAPARRSGRSRTCLSSWAVRFAPARSTNTAAASPKPPRAMARLRSPSAAAATNARLTVVRASVAAPRTAGSDATRP